MSNNQLTDSYLLCLGDRKQVLLNTDRINQKIRTEITNNSEKFENEEVSLRLSNSSRANYLVHKMVIDGVITEAILEQYTKITQYTRLIVVDKNR